MILPRKPDSTIANGIAAGTRYLLEHELVYGHGTASAADDAAWLLLEAAGLSPLEEPDYDRVLDDSVMEQAEDWLRRRAVDKVPAAYIVGRMWFAGFEFSVDERVLVPRSPLAEFLTNDCFGLLDGSQLNRVLDLCTGSGCIAIAAAQLFGSAMVDAVDISADALEVARHNVNMHRLTERVTISRGDLFESAGHNYDLIISNPPYVDAADIDSMGDEFRHEPILGLAAGDDGLSIAHRILAESASRLSADGVLVCEVGNSAEALENAYPDTVFSWLEFSEGGDGIFALDRQELLDLQRRVI